MNQEKLFFIGKGKLENIKKTLSIDPVLFIEYYNSLENTKKYDINLSKYMKFDEDIKKKFIEKWPILATYLNVLSNQSKSLNVNLKQKLISDYFSYIPKEKQLNFVNDINKL
jgi:hypothetical protein